MIKMMEGNRLSAYRKEYTYVTNGKHIRFCVLKFLFVLAWDYNTKTS